MPTQVQPSFKPEKLQLRTQSGRFASINAIEEQIRLQQEREARLRGDTGSTTIVEQEYPSLNAPPPPDEEIAEVEEKPSFWKNALTRARELQKEQAKQLVRASRRGGTNTKDFLERIPIPGDISVPLIVLLVLFLAIIPANGHTRLTWIWLVVIGNARITRGTTSGVTVQQSDILNAQGQVVGSSADFGGGGGPGITTGNMTPTPSYTAHDPQGLRPNQYLTVLGGYSEDGY